MTTVRNILQIKGNQVWTISPETSILDALKFMVEKQVGALVITEKDQIAGIISERDFVHSVAKTGKYILDSAVKQYMTKAVYVINIDALIEDCMQLMTEKRIRHLPVMENNKMVGLVSIGDIVKSIIANRESTIESLESYIVGSYR
jgi:CBS domain-containing protein